MWRVRRTVLALLGASVVVSIAQTVRADAIGPRPGGTSNDSGDLPDDDAAGKPTTKAHFGGQRSIGFGLGAGFYVGEGALVVLDAAPVGLMISGGYVPLFIFGNKVEGKDGTFDYFGSEQVNADLLIGPLYREKRVTIDLMLGYRYNTVLGSGQLELPFRK
jgi:hypothetical protein